MELNLICQYLLLQLFVHDGNGTVFLAFDLVLWSRISYVEKIQQVNFCFCFVWTLILINWYILIMNEARVSVNFHGEYELTSDSRLWRCVYWTAQTLANLFANRQSDSMSLRVHLLAMRIWGLPESFEDIADFLFCHPNSLVKDSDFKFEFVVFSVASRSYPRVHFDETFVSLKFDRILDNIEQHLLQSALVKQHDWKQDRALVSALNLYVFPGQGEA